MDKNVTISKRLFVWAGLAIACGEAGGYLMKRIIDGIIELIFGLCC